MTVEKSGAAGRRTSVGDILIVVLAVAAGVLSLAFVSGAGSGDRGTMAVVEVNGRVVNRVTLAPGQKARRFTVDGWQGASTFEVEDGTVRMVESACRDKICVGLGRVGTAGRSVVCLPNRVVIRVTGGTGRVDSVTE